MYTNLPILIMILHNKNITHDFTLSKITYKIGQ